MRQLKFLVSAVLALSAIALTPSRAEATSITVSDTYDWNQNGTGVQTFHETQPPTWSHLLAFASPAVSISTATLDLSHFGNRNNANNEVWLMSSQGGAILIGQLLTSDTGFITQTFTIPSSLYPSLPAGGWTLTIGLNETQVNPNGNPNASANNNFLTLDFATLNVTYDNGVTSFPPTAPVPEPGSLLLLGSGLAGLAAYVRKRRK